MSRMKKGIILMTVAGCLLFGAVACENTRFQSAQAPIESTEEKIYMTYQDEELGFSFEIEEELYGGLICEITPEEKDTELKQQKIVANFYKTAEEERVPFFQIYIFKGGNDRAYMQEKLPELTYIGSANGYTYAIKYEDKTYHLPNPVKVMGVMEGIFESEEMTEEAGETEGTTVMDYRKEVIMIEGMETEITLAKVTSRLGYELEYDADSFGYEAEENTERYIGQNAEGESYPNIYFTVTRVENGDVAEMSQAIVDEYKKDATGQTRKQKATIGNKEHSYDATKITYKEGNNWNSILKESYLIEQEGVVYQIDLGYFLEAEEGYGTYLHRMLESFICG